MCFVRSEYSSIYDRGFHLPDNDDNRHAGSGWSHVLPHIEIHSPYANLYTVTHKAKPLARFFYPNGILKTTMLLLAFVSRHLSF